MNDRGKDRTKDRVEDQVKAVSTFSIVAFDAESSDLGVATASKFLAVGSVVPFAEAGLGAVATQSYANTTFGPRTIMALRGGISLELIHQAFAESDDQHSKRQYGLVDASGRAFTFTGADCHPWAGGRTGAGYAAQGNLLTGPEVVDALAETFEGSRGPLADRLVMALEAADAAGGDQRGRQSAALLVVRKGGGMAALTTTISTFGWTTTKRRLQSWGVCSGCSASTSSGPRVPTCSR